LYIYLFENQANTRFVFGGFTSEIKELEDAISYIELKEIISTIRILD